MGMMTIWNELGKGLRLHGIGIQYYWKTYMISNTTLGFTWIKESDIEKSSTPLGLHEGLVLLKDLPNPPRLNRIYMNKQITKI